jgi:hypothetical protein
MLQEALAVPSWLHDQAMAAEESSDRKLNQWVPEPADLQAYLAQVRSLLLGVSDKLAGKSKMTDEQKVYTVRLFIPLPGRRAAGGNTLKRASTDSARVDHR